MGILRKAVTCKCPSCKRQIRVLLDKDNLLRAVLYGAEVVSTAKRGRNDVIVTSVECKNCQSILYWEQP